MEFKSLIMRFGPMAEIKLDAADIETLIISGISDEIIVMGKPKTTQLTKTCEVFHVHIKPSANMPDCVVNIRPDMDTNKPGWFAGIQGKSLFDTIEDLGNMTEATVVYDDGTETTIVMPYEDNEAYDNDETNETNLCQRMKKTSAGFFIGINKNRKPETKQKASPVKISVTPGTDANGNSLQDYKIKVFFPALNYTHEETFVGTNLSDAETAANFIARAVARELRANLDDVINTSW